MMLDWLILIEDENREEDNYEAKKRAFLTAFPSTKLYQKLFGKNADNEEMEIKEVPLDSPEALDELKALLEEVGLGSDIEIPLLERIDA